MGVTVAHGLSCPVDHALGRGKVRIADTQHDDIFTALFGLLGEIVQIPDIGGTAFNPVG